MTAPAPDSACRLSLLEARDRIRAGSLASVELVQSCLSRIEQLDARLQAWVRLCPARALDDARRIDSLTGAEKERLPLAGIPVGVKDVYHTAGIETSAGSPILKGFVPAEDAAAVRRIRESGAIVLGKTATTEFACFDPAPTRNPHNPDHTPGGSSSGSAAAVAAYMCPAALGTQTSGSVLRPASFCGVAGLKPTYDTIERAGIVPLAWSLDHAGVLARSSADAGLLLDVLSARPRPPAAAAATLRLGIPDRYFTNPEREMMAAFEHAVGLFARMGVAVRQVRLPEIFEAGVAAGHIVMRVEAAAFHHQWFESRGSEYSPKLRALIEAGRHISGPAYIRAQQVRREAVERMREWFADIDVVATPAAPGAAPEGLASTGDPVFNAPWTTFGFPAIAIPMGETAAGLPLGLQLAAAPLGESLLLRAAGAFERCRGVT